MAAATQYIKHGWVWACFMLLFFFNTALPEGMTLCLLLTPLWMYLLHRANGWRAAIALLLPLALYTPIHLSMGVNYSHYAVSATILAAVILFNVAFYYVLKDQVIHLDLIFRDIAILNFLLAVACIPLLGIPVLKETVWYMVPISNNIEPVPRLKLFTSEASHYSFLLAPVAIYFYSRAMFFPASNPLFTLFLVSVPLVMSFSLGVLLGLIVSGVIVAGVYMNRMLFSKERRTRFLTMAMIAATFAVALYFLFPHSPLFLRVNNIINGLDTSAKGRTSEAFVLAHKIAEKKSLLWGVGPGQLKLLGRNIVIEFYKYSDIPASIRIPNACAETIAYFGYVGFGLRMLAEGFLFVKTRVYDHPLRLWLFLFVFIYQFTGSYITNVSEYAIWILAFSNIFPEYISNKPPLPKSQLQEHEHLIPGESYAV